MLYPDPTQRLPRVQLKLQCTASNALEGSRNVNSAANISQVTTPANASASWKSAALGGAGAGFLGRILTAPFDVIKIRMQLNGS